MRSFLDAHDRANLPDEFQVLFALSRVSDEGPVRLSAVWSWTSRTEPTGPRVRASEEWTEPTFGGPGRDRTLGVGPGSNLDRT